MRPNSLRSTVRNATLLAALLLCSACGSDDANRPEPLGPDALDSAEFKAVIEVSDDEPASIGTYIATVEYPDGTRYQVSGERDGSFSETWLGDIGGGETPELVLWMVSAGSGSYASIHVWGMTARGPRLTDATPLPDSLSHGYMGHDRLWIEDAQLLRCFLIYGPEDPVTEPSGGERCFVYDRVYGWALQ